MNHGMNCRWLADNDEPCTCGAAARSCNEALREAVTLVEVAFTEDGDGQLRFVSHERALGAIRALKAASALWRNQCLEASVSFGAVSPSLRARVKSVLSEEANDAATRLRLESELTAARERVRAVETLIRIELQAREDACGLERLASRTAREWTAFDRSIAGLRRKLVRMELEASMLEDLMASRSRERMTQMMS